MRKLTGVLVAVWLCGAATGARAQATEDDVAQAKKYFEAGRQAYENGQYVVAIAAFEEAYRLSPRASVVFSLGQAYRRQYFVDHDPAKLKRAVELYRQYVAEVQQGGRRDEAVQYISELEPLLARVEDEQQRTGKGPVEAAPPPQQRTQLMISSRAPGAQGAVDDDPLSEAPVVREVTPGKHRVRVEAPGFFGQQVEGVAVEGRLIVVEVELQEKPALVTVRAPAGASVSVDGRPAGSAPLARPLEVPAGRHFLAVTRRGHKPFTRELTLDRGQELDLSARLPRTRQRVASYWVFGGAGVVLLAGGVTTGLALAAQGDAEDIADRAARENIPLEELDAYNDALDRRDGLRTASVVLYGGALGLCATAALLYFVDHPDVEAPEGVTGGRLAPAVGDGSVGVTWGGSF